MYSADATLNKNALIHIKRPSSHIVCCNTGITDYQGVHIYIYIYSTLIHKIKKIFLYSLHNCKTLSNITFYIVRK